MKKYTTKIIYFLVSLTPAISFAQQIKIKNPISQDSIMGLINTILTNILLPIGAIVVVMSIIYSGFRFVTAQGKPAEIEKAKQRMMWTLIGAVVLLGAVAISEVLRNTINNIVKP